MFGMSHPLALLALLLVGVPVILYIIRHRHLNVQEFPAAVLVAELGYIRTSRARLLERILLALRILTVVGLVLILAGAFMVPPPGMVRFLPPRRKSDMLVLIDDSPSMDIRLSNGLTAYTAAFEFASGLQDRYNSAGKVEVRRLSGLAPEDPFPAYHVHAGAYMTRALQRELASMPTVPVLVFLTDNAVSNPGPVAGVEAAYPVVVSRISTLPDVAVLNASSDTPVLLSGQGCVLSVQLASTGPGGDAELCLLRDDATTLLRTVSLEIPPAQDEALLDVSIDVPPGPEGITEYVVRFDAAWDAYPINNTIRLPVNRLRAPRVLLAGDKNEIFSKALFPSGTPFLDGVLGTSVAAADLPEVLDADVDVLILVSAGDGDQGAATRVTSYLAGGGCVIDLFSAGTTPPLPSAVFRERVIVDPTPDMQFLAGLFRNRLGSWTFVPQPTQRPVQLLGVSGTWGNSTAVYMVRHGKGRRLICGLDLTGLETGDAPYLPIVLRELIRVVMRLPAPVLTAEAGSQIDVLDADIDGIAGTGDQGFFRFTGSFIIPSRTYPASIRYAPVDTDAGFGVGILPPASEHIPWRFAGSRPFAGVPGWSQEIVELNGLHAMLQHSMLSVSLGASLGLACLLLVLAGTLLSNMLAAERARTAIAPGRERLAV